MILSLESRPISFRSCESTFQSNAHIFSPSPFRWTLNVENANTFSAPEKSHPSKHAIFVKVLLPIPLFVTAFDVSSFFQLVNMSLIANMANIKMNFLQIQLQMFIVLETKWCGRCYAFDAFCVSLFPQFQRFLILNSVDNRQGGIICCLVR